MDIGITKEQFEKLKGSLACTGVDICYDIKTNDWKIEPGVLVAAICMSLEIEPPKDVEEFTIKLFATLATINAERKLKEIFTELGLFDDTGK